MWVICAILVFLGVDFHYFYLKIHLFLLPLQRFFKSENIDCQDRIMQKELKEESYNKTDCLKVKYEENLDSNDSGAYYGVMWR